MWGKREFIDSSSSSESLSTRPSIPAPLQSDPSIPVPLKHIPKPPSTRPNARILSIQRAKLLTRGHESIRIETSPFFRNPFISYPLPSDPNPVVELKIVKKDQKPETEEIEEIKIDEKIIEREKKPIKKFLRNDSPERIDLSIVQKEKREDEITPEPKHQRVIVQTSTAKERPTSQVSYRRSVKDFKAVTVVAVKKGSSCGISTSSGFKQSAFKPVPLSSSLVLVITKLRDDLNPKFIQFNVNILSTGLLIFSCRRQNSGNFIFSLSENDFSKKSEKFLGTIKAINGKNLFKFYDFGKKIPGTGETRKQYGFLVHEQNQFFVVIPKVENDSIVELQPEIVAATQSECNFGPTTVQKFIQKQVNSTSILPRTKNFILTDEKVLKDYIKLEKIHKGTYKLFIFSPFSPFQAACIAMAFFK